MRRCREVCRSGFGVDLETRVRAIADARGVEEADPWAGNRQEACRGRITQASTKIKIPGSWFDKVSRTGQNV